MKLSRKEFYNLKLSKDELIFLLKMIDKVQLDGNSSEQAVVILNRFKKLVNKPQEDEYYNEADQKQIDELQLQTIDEEYLQCEVCDTTTEITSTIEDPIDSTKKITICGSCVMARKAVADKYKGTNIL